MSILILVFMYGIRNTLGVSTYFCWIKILHGYSRDWTEPERVMRPLSKPNRIFFFGFSLTLLPLLLFSAVTIKELKRFENGVVYV
jgi:hypothetical protein